MNMDDIRLYSAKQFSYEFSYLQAIDKGGKGEGNPKDIYITFSGVFLIVFSFAGYDGDPVALAGKGMRQLLDMGGNTSRDRRVIHGDHENIHI
jgi:hypothetical protein